MCKQSLNKSIKKPARAGGTSRANVKDRLRQSHAGLQLPGILFIAAEKA
jgi:hypothetical protein